jgi:hypothetical protein
LRKEEGGRRREGGREEEGRRKVLEGREIVWIVSIKSAHPCCDLAIYDDYQAKLVLGQVAS